MHDCFRQLHYAANIQRRERGLLGRITMSEILGGIRRRRDLLKGILLIKFHLLSLSWATELCRKLQFTACDFVPRDLWLRRLFSIEDCLKYLGIKLMFSIY